VVKARVDQGYWPSWDAPASALFTSLRAPSSWRSRLWICWSAFEASLLLFCVLEPEFVDWDCCDCVVTGVLAGALELVALAGVDGDPQAESASVSDSATIASMARHRKRDRVNQYIDISLKALKFSRGYLLYTV
jgi:hypothetical protein